MNGLVTPSDSIPLTIQDESREEGGSVKHMESIGEVQSASESDENRVHKRIRVRGLNGTDDEDDEGGLWGLENERTWLTLEQRREMAAMRLAQSKSYTQLLE
ncbi:hypothetical protein MMC14_010354, partial [Varicellaria rhodocarpa]|nr:hypothetical protein [Varicellaria rhodocarpa]